MTDDWSIPKIKRILTTLYIRFINSDIQPYTGYLKFQKLDIKAGYPVPRKNEMYAYKIQYLVH